MFGQCPPDGAEGGGLAHLLGVGCVDCFLLNRIETCALNNIPRSGVLGVLDFLLWITFHWITFVYIRFRGVPCILSAGPPCETEGGVSVSSVLPSIRVGGRHADADVRR
jgi:hypothetical protein